MFFQFQRQCFSVSAFPVDHGKNDQYRQREKQQILPRMLCDPVPPVQKSAVAEVGGDLAFQQKQSVPERCGCYYDLHITGSGCGIKSDPALFIGQIDFGKLLALVRLEYYALYPNPQAQHALSLIQMSIRL